MERIIDNLKKVLIIEPHSDDGGFSMGGTLAKFKDAGIKMQCLCVFSASTPVIQNIRREEGRELYCDILEGDIKFLDFIDAFYRKENLASMYIKLRNQVKNFIIENRPDCIFAPMAIGSHIDHEIVSKVVLELAKSLRNIPIYFYEDFPYCCIEEKIPMKKIFNLQKKYVFEKFMDISGFLYDKASYYMVYSSQGEKNYKEILEIYRELGKKNGLEGTKHDANIVVGNLYERFWELCSGG